MKVKLLDLFFHENNEDHPYFDSHIIADYAQREWAGLIQHYYTSRWTFFCDWLLSHDTFNSSAFNTAIFNIVEKPVATRP